MSDDELIEKAAKAIYDRQWMDPDWSSVAESTREGYREDVRAAFAVFEQAQPEPEYEYRIDDGKTLSYTRTRSRVARALRAGGRAWRRLSARRASAWEFVDETEAAPGGES